MSGKSMPAQSANPVATAPKPPRQRPPGRQTDRRVLRTRNILGDALVALIHEKNFEDITVQQVLDRAGVGRATFYTHYRGKEDLFLSDVEDFFELCASLLKRNSAGPRRLAPVAELFAHIRSVRQFLAALVAAGKIDDVFTLGRGILARSIDDRLQSAGLKMVPARRSACAHAIAGSLFSLLDWWIAKDMKPDPNEMDTLFHTLAWNGLAACAKSA